MNCTLSTTRNSYGFGHDWSLITTTDKGTKVFYLGQDVKFCRRVLGLEPNDVVSVIGDNNLGDEKNLQKLANFIVERLDLSDEVVDNLELWELCCQ